MFFPNNKPELPEPAASAPAEESAQPAAVVPEPAKEVVAALEPVPEPPVAEIEPAVPEPVAVESESLAESDNVTDVKDEEKLPEPVSTTADLVSIFLCAALLRKSI